VDALSDLPKALLGQASALSARLRRPHERSRRRPPRRGPESPGGGEAFARRCRPCAPHVARIGAVVGQGSDRAAREAGGGAADADFWSVAGQTELQLFKALPGGARLASVRESLERGYLDLYKRVSAAWMWASVYDNARFVLQKYTARATASERKAAAALLERLAAFAQLQPVSKM
jgi:hypothetical protein